MYGGSTLGASNFRILAMSLIACAMCWAAVAHSQTRAPFDEQFLQALNSRMSQFVTEKKVKGLSIALAHNGKVVTTGTFGEMKDDSIVRIYSMTKPITSVAMMILFEQGKWRLDDPLTKFIPEFKNLKVMTGVDSNGNLLTAPATRPPTIRELMSHSAGFGYGLFPVDPIEKQFQEAAPLRSKSLKEMIDKIAAIPLRFEPGSDWFYSIAVDIQGYLVEKLSGQKLGDFLEQKIFQPLKMADTGFQTGVAKANRLVPVYVADPKTGVQVETKEMRGIPMPNFIDAPNLQSGGGGLVSTLHDYGRFAQMILNGGQLDGVRIISAESVKLMGENALSKEATAKLAHNTLWKAKGSGFGLGFGVVIDPSKDANHSGKGTLTWGGAAGTWFWIDPVNDIYFVGLVQTFDQATKDELREVSRKLVYDAIHASAKQSGVRVQK